MSKHREVMAVKIGRPLLRTEVVHHIDGNNLNNDPDNLMLFKTNSEHVKFHAIQKREVVKVSKKCSKDKKGIRVAIYNNYIDDVKLITSEMNEAYSYIKKSK